jgi:sulfhydrogenase subunit alpha
MSRKIEIGYLAMVEGEAGVKVELSGDKVKEVLVDVWEPPRFFEGFLVGRKYDEAPDLVSRICGICPVSHMTTAILALERALGITPSEQTESLRRLLCKSQIAASHLVHLYVLVLPDYAGQTSLFSMLPEYEHEFERFLRMKDVLNRVTESIGGRALHPVTHMVGGFTHVPLLEDLKSLGKDLVGLRDDAFETAKLFANLEYPEFESGLVQVSLKPGAAYFDSQDLIKKGLETEIPLESYHEHFTEEHTPPSNAKRSTLDATPFRVGALARVNNGFGSLTARTRDMASAIGYENPDMNPFHNNIAQALEIAEAIEECIREIEEIRKLRRENGDFRVRGGRGHAMTEAPRGLLYYEYDVNDRGTIEKANIVTPTSHHVLAMEEDIAKLTESMSGSQLTEIEGALKKLVRAYDPCFSCSVHIAARKESLP